MKCLFSQFLNIYKQIFLHKYSMAMLNMTSVYNLLHIIKITKM